VHAGLLLVFDLAHHWILTLTLLGTAFCWLPFAAGRLARGGAPGKAILWGALLLRLPLLPLPPTLSDDVLRYLWDGKVAAAGHNPYALAPAAGELASLRDEIWQELPHQQVPTVYPPLAVTAFSIASRLPFPLLAWKTMATAADLLACALLLALAGRRGIPAGQTAWYAWNPLVALEAAGMGHVDALGVAAVLGAVLCLTPRQGERPRAALAGVWAAAAALAKLVPLAALPLWSRASRRPLVFAGTALGLTAVALAPVAASTGGIPPGLLTYGVSWEFNGPVYEPLWRLLDRAGAAPALADGLDAHERRYERWTQGDPYYPYLYPQFLAKLILGLGVLAVVARSALERDPVAGTGRLFGGLLLLSATVYPWYLLWVLPWAALARHRAWLALSALMPLAYLADPRVAGVPLFPWLYLAIWGPFAVLLVLERFLKGRRP
jgi:hypothetical protein